MLGFLVPVEVVDENGDSTWKEIKVHPSEGAGGDAVEFTLGMSLAADDIVVVKLDDLTRVLSLVVQEHGRASVD